MKPLNTYYQPEEIVCNNINVNQKYPQWVCKANNPNIEIHDYIISCEGKRGENDFMVLEDSCYIEFNLLFKNQRNRDEIKYNRYSNVFDLFNEFFDNGNYRQNNKNLKPIKLNDISFLVFNKNQMTSSKKGQYFPQLYPAQGNEYEPDQVACRNVGFDGEKPIWKCTGYLPYPYKFASARVSCEGWSGPGDNQIVPGSCMLKYKVDHVIDQYENEYDKQYDKQNVEYEDDSDDVIDHFFQFLMGLIIMSLITYLIIKCWAKCFISCLKDCCKDCCNNNERKQMKQPQKINIQEESDDSDRQVDQKPQVVIHHYEEVRKQPEVVVIPPVRKEKVVIIGKTPAQVSLQQEFEAERLRQERIRLENERIRLEQDRLYEEQKRRRQQEEEERKRQQRRREEEEQRKRNEQAKKQETEEEAKKRQEIYADTEVR